MILSEWARQWGVSPAAMADLRLRVMNLEGALPAERADLSEAGVQSRVRLRAAKLGTRLWRNNVGAFHDAERNIHVRFGLANDSAQVNAVVKSADLIGIRPRLIQPSDVGLVIGQFVSFETKHGSWTWKGTEHEVAQANWATLINSLGGEARFATSEFHV